MDDMLEKRYLANSFLITSGMWQASVSFSRVYTAVHKDTV